MIIDIVSIWVTILITAVVVLLYYNAFVIEKKKNSIKEREVENEKMKILMAIDTKAAQEEIDSLIQRYFGEYTLYNFVAQKKVYIKKEDCNLAIREVTKKVMLNMSETYLFYFKVLYYIKDEDDLLEKINNMVSELMLSYMVEFNKPKE